MIYVTFYDNITDHAEVTRGPFRSLQMTYNHLRTEDDRTVARIIEGVWEVEDHDDAEFTDFVIHDPNADRLLAEARKPYADKIMELERLLRHANGTLAHLEHGINEHRRVERNLMESA